MNHQAQLSMALKITFKKYDQSKFVGYIEQSHTYVYYLPFIIKYLINKKPSERGSKGLMIKMSTIPVDISGFY